MDATTEQNALARAIQECVPLSPRPFDELGQRLGIAPARVLEQLRAWSAEDKLRELSAVLEGSLLGYESALCTTSVPEADLPRVVDVVNEHPTVTHNYLRDHSYNLWFTLAVPRAMGLARTLRRLAAHAGVPRFHAARRTQTFKVGVNFDLLARQSITEEKPLPAAPPVELTPREERLFRALQTPAPLVERPFAALARGAGTSEEELLEFARRHLGGAIRRYVGTFRHRKLGVRGNGMVVWNVPHGRLAEAGARLARAPEVSHCYAREPLPGFPYTLYSMVHGPDEESCRGVAARLAPEVGTGDYLILFGTREFKKCRLRYFLPELDQWWAVHDKEAAA